MFRDEVVDDVRAVFMNLDEFGEEIDFDGHTVRAVIDDSHASISTGSAQGFSDASGLGLLKEVRTLYMEDTIAPRPVPEQLVTINGERWQIGPDDTSVKEEMGVLVLELQRAYS